MDALAGFGATLGSWHTYKDGGLIITNPLIAQTPEPKTVLVDIPGSSTVLDMSEALTGRVEYARRQLTFELAGAKPATDWPRAHSQIVSLLHGKRLDIVLDEEPDWAFTGRVSVSGLERVGDAGTLTITADCDAYRHSSDDSLGSWLWDSLNFETGTIREWANLTVDGTLQVVLPASPAPSVPTFIVSNLAAGAEAKVRISRRTYTLVSGRNRFAQESLTGQATVTFTGTFTVSIDYRPRSL